MADGRSFASYLVHERLVLGIEPGRALADQVAISVFRVLRVKELGPDAHVIFVEGSSFSACETWFGSEFLVDPILVPAISSPVATKPIRAYLAGHSCLDEDVLCNRWLTFRSRRGRETFWFTPTPAVTRWTSLKANFIVTRCRAAFAWFRMQKGS